MMTNAMVLKAKELLEIEIVEIEWRFIVFQIPEIKYSWNSSYLVSGTLPIRGGASSYEFTGKIKCLETAEGFSRLRFDLLQYDRALWLEFLDQLKVKQTRTDKIFSSIKGED